MSLFDIVGGTFASFIWAEYPSFENNSVIESELFSILVSYILGRPFFISITHELIWIFLKGQDTDKDYPLKGYIWLH